MVRRNVGTATAAFARLALAAVALMVAPMARQAAAQNRGATRVDFTGGWAGFGDSGLVSEALLGGAARVYVHPRVGVGPELAYIVGQSHTHLMLTANLTWDLARRPAASSRVVTPYLLVGSGLFHTRWSSFARSSVSREVAFTLGAGARWTVSDRVTVGAEARLGGPPHFRINGVVGVHVGH